MWMGMDKRAPNTAAPEAPLAKLHSLLEIGRRGSDVVCQPVFVIVVLLAVIFKTSLL